MSRDSPSIARRGGVDADLPGRFLRPDPKAQIQHDVHSLECLVGSNAYPAIQRNQALPEPIALIAIDMLYLHIARSIVDWAVR